MGYRSVFRCDLFAGQVILVTGGGSGIGRCVAHELAALGATVVIAGRDPAKLARVREEIGASAGPVETIPCNIRSEPDVAAMIARVLALHGRLDGLVNNAGGQFHAPLADITPEGFEAVVSTNLTGGFIVMREAYRQWMREHGGAIVNMSADIWMGLPGFAHSAASRAGMESLTQSAAAEWAGSGIRVNTVAPGMIESSGFDNYEGPGVAQIRAYPERVPAKRYGTVAEVSAAIVFLLSPAAAYITGSCLRVDGGSPNGRHGQALKQAAGLPAFDGFHLSARPALFAEEESEP